MIELVHVVKKFHSLSLGERVRVRGSWFFAFGLARVRVPHD
jgi:hypothetical protein